MSQLDQEQLVDLKRFGDWTSWLSWLILLVILPFSALSIAGIAWLPAVVWAVWDGSFLRNLILLTVGYFALLPIVFVPGLDWLQIKLIAPDSRAPTPQERSHLRPAWQAVLRRVGKGGNRRYLLRVVDSDEMNAYAGGGRLVIVTSLALRLLRQSELEAVLSHELGHHAGMHPIVLLVTSWFKRPIIWFHSLLRIVHDLLIWAINTTSRRWLSLVLLVISLAPRAVLGLLAFVYKAATLVLLFFGRQAEHQADATAVKLGYSQPLIQALNTFEGATGSQQSGEAYDAALEKAGLPARKTRWDTHPPIARRVQKIMRAMDRLTGARSPSNNRAPAAAGTAGAASANDAIR